MVHLNALAAPTGYAELEVHASLLDVANGLIDSLDSTVRAAISLFLIVVLSVKLAMNFTLVKLISFAFVGAIAVWILLMGGIETIAGLFGDEIDEADTSSSAVIQTVDDPALPGPGTDPGRL